MATSTRRTGDDVAIGGDYQYRALHEGSAIQRFWHLNKQTTIARLLPPAPTDRVLDVGCGSGVIASFLAGSAAHVLGIDGNERAIAFARTQFGASNLAFHEGLVDEEFQLDEPVDKIYCLELIEHIYRDQACRMLENFGRLLKPGGVIYLTTPNYRSFWPVIEWLMDALRLAPRLANDQHVVKYHRRKLTALCREVGFEVDQVATTCFLAPWIAPLSGRLARWVDEKETKLDILPGSILVCTLRKRAAE